jgi:hypothetical protein
MSVAPAVPVGKGLMDCRLGTTNEPRHDDVGRSRRQPRRPQLTNGRIVNCSQVLFSASAGRARWRQSSRRWLRRGSLVYSKSREPEGVWMFLSLQRSHDVRALVIASTVGALLWYAEAETPRLFENERVIAWRFASGERPEPLVRDRRLPGVIVTLAAGAVQIVDDVNMVTIPDVAPPSGVVLIGVRDHPRDRLETPFGMIPAFPREGVRRVVENDRVTIWAVSWTKGMKPRCIFTTRMSWLSTWTPERCGRSLRAARQWRRQGWPGTRCSSRGAEPTSKSVSMAPVETSSSN